MILGQKSCQLERYFGPTQTNNVIILRSTLAQYDHNTLIQTPIWKHVWSNTAIKTPSFEFIGVEEDENNHQWLNKMKVSLETNKECEPKKS
jgi:hypothetical protein